MQENCNKNNTSYYLVLDMYHDTAPSVYPLTIQVEGWTSLFPKTQGAKPTPTTTPSTISSAKDRFVASLTDLDTLNQHDKDRTRLLQEMIDSKVEVPIQEYKRSGSNASIENPGLWQSMQPVAKGTWKVVYAPHMTTMAGIAGGSLDVSYILSEDGTIISHAVCKFPWLVMPSGCLVLSVSGTFSSVSSTVCRVDFDRAWVTLDSEEPYATFEAVPENGSKTIISSLGQLFFIEQVSVFPVSWLDDDLIVFDFELLGTRICARKID